MANKSRKTLFDLNQKAEESNRVLEPCNRKVTIHPRNGKIAIDLCDKTYPEHGGCTDLKNGLTKGEAWEYLNAFNRGVMTKDYDCKKKK